MTSDLSDLARVLGLNACAGVLEAFGTLPAPAPPDPALAAAPATDPHTGLAQLVRRGLELSGGVSLVTMALSDDLVARGLLAWDVLNGSLVPPDADRDRLRADATAVRTILPDPGRRYVKLDPKRGAPLGDGGGEVRINRVMRAFFGECDPADVSPGALDRARNFARILHRSHLPTMASYYLADLFFAHGYYPALVDLVEVLLDHGAPDVEALLTAIGDPAPTAEPSMVELYTYARVRTRFSQNNAGEDIAFAEASRRIFETLHLDGDKAATVNPRPTLAYCEAALHESKQTITFAHVEALARLELPWRYAYRVLTVYAASRTSGPEFIGTFSTYLQSFGNDFITWYECAGVMPDGAKWARGFLATLVCELQTLPHEVEAWKAAAMILGDGDLADAALAECEARLREQATLS